MPRSIHRRLRVYQVSTCQMRFSSLIQLVSVLCVCPRQRRLDDRRVDLLIDLGLHRGFVCVFIHTIGPTPSQDLILCQIGIGRERITGRGEPASTVSGSTVSLAVLDLSAIDPPTYSDHALGRIRRGRGGFHPLDLPYDCCHDLGSFKGCKLGLHRVKFSFKFLNGFDKNWD